MGVFIKAKCQDCNWEREFLFGAGMNDFMHSCDVPAINKKTGKFVVKDILDGSVDSNKYVFYNDPKMNVNPIGKDFIQWGEVFLQRTENYCPSCKSFGLSFEDFGSFD